MASLQLVFGVDNHHLIMCLGLVAARVQHWSGWLDTHSLSTLVSYCRVSLSLSLISCCVPLIKPNWFELFLQSMRVSELQARSEKPTLHPETGRRVKWKLQHQMKDEISMFLIEEITFSILLVLLNRPFFLSRFAGFGAQVDSPCFRQQLCWLVL